MEASEYVIKVHTIQPLSDRLHDDLLAEERAIIPQEGNAILFTTSSWLELTYLTYLSSVAA